MIHFISIVILYDLVSRGITLLLLLSSFLIFLYYFILTFAPSHAHQLLYFILLLMVYLLSYVGVPFILNLFLYYYFVCFF